MTTTTKNQGTLTVSEGVIVAHCARCGGILLQCGAWWKHAASAGELIAGCRAASFNPDDGWDDTLDRNWKAKVDASRIPDENLVKLWLQGWLEARCG